MRFDAIRPVLDEAIRCAVCRCFHGALRFSSRMRLTISAYAVISPGAVGPSFLASGRRCSAPREPSVDALLTSVPHFLMVPTPNSYSLRISSNSSTLALQSNQHSPIRATAMPGTDYAVHVSGENFAGFLMVSRHGGFIHRECVVTTGKGTCTYI
jgi:hypothetical protein